MCAWEFQPSGAALVWGVGWEDDEGREIPEMEEEKEGGSRCKSWGSGLAWRKMQQRVHLREKRKSKLGSAKNLT